MEYVLSKQIAVGQDGIDSIGCKKVENRNILVEVAELKHL